MGILSLLFISSKRSSLFYYSLHGKQLTFITSKRNTTTAQPRRNVSRVLATSSERFHHIKIQIQKLSTVDPRFSDKM